MARAKRQGVIPTPPPPDEIVLTLTEAEAKTLRFICDNIAGEDSGPRGHTDSIARALSEVGVTRPRLRTAPHRHDIEFI